MNDDRQHETDDELLSAYLDDELSAEERALVESRLAADPAAQQALDQLRNVSQSVRSLPKQGAPSDLQEAVLRRIEGLKKEPVAAPVVSIGQTRRGWIWASLAVAAALLIMVVRTENGDHADVSDVALKAPVSADERGQAVEAPSQWGARNKAAENAPAAPSGAPAIVASPAERDSVSRDLDQRVATSGPVPSSAAVTDADPNSVEGRTDSSVSESLSLQGSSRPTAAAPMSEAAAEPLAEEDQLVVVHVLAKPSAIKNKAFDALLANNGIVVDSADGEDAALRFGGETSAPQPENAVVSGRIAESQPQAQQPADDKSQIQENEQLQQQDVEVVLVEAPSTTIFSCMEDLNHDSDNYLGVLVDPSPATDDAAVKEKLPQVKKLATDLGIYNRGSVPLEAEDAFQGDKVWYDFYYDALSARSGATPMASRSGGGFGGAREESLQASGKLSSNMDRGRARRLQAPAAPSRQSIELYSRSAPPTDGLDIAEGKIAGTEIMKRRAMLRELKDSSGAGEDPMRVLFVLRSVEEPPASAPAADRAE